MLPAGMIIILGVGGQPSVSPSAGLAAAGPARAAQTVEARDVEVTAPLAPIGAGGTLAELSCDTRTADLGFALDAVATLTVNGLPATAEFSWPHGEQTPSAHDRRPSPRSARCATGRPDQCG